ncbi:hypothetical protein BC830DRAFT_1164651 [Chytriomyces sp. MP71]|nr:hypothetical protein BC830DRAFT_1164651 [Chytriomyces sp. MP71]
MSTTDRVIPTSRRADGTLRKEVRVRNGYTPQEDVQRFTPSRARQADARAVALGGSVVGMPPPPPSSAQRVHSANSATVSGIVSAEEAVRIRVREQTKEEKRRAAEERKESARRRERDQDRDRGGTVVLLEARALDAGLAAEQPTMPPTSLPELEKKLKGLKKKHRQILDLEEKMVGSDVAIVEFEVREKLKKKGALEAQMEELEAKIVQMAM